MNEEEPRGRQFYKYQVFDKDNNLLFEGKSKDAAEYIGVDIKRLRSASTQVSYKDGQYIVRRSGLFEKTYDYTDRKGVTYVGTLSEISKQSGVSIGTIIRYNKLNGKVRTYAKLMYKVYENDICIYFGNPKEILEKFHMTKQKLDLLCSNCGTENGIYTFSKTAQYDREDLFGFTKDIHSALDYEINRIIQFCNLPPYFKTITDRHWKTKELQARLGDNYIIEDKKDRDGCRWKEVTRKVSPEEYNSMVHEAINEVCK